MSFIDANIGVDIGVIVPDISGGGDIPDDDGDRPGDDVSDLDDVTPDGFHDTLATLDAADLAALKLNCEDILANPSGFSDTAVAICMIAARR